MDMAAELAIKVNEVRELCGMFHKTGNIQTLHDIGQACVRISVLEGNLHRYNRRFERNYSDEDKYSDEENNE